MHSYDLYIALALGMTLLGDNNIIVVLMYQRTPSRAKSFLIGLHVKQNNPINHTEELFHQRLIPSRVIRNPSMEEKRQGTLGLETLS
jgi:hypothetical protein